MLGCNKTKVKETGDDPCSAGSITEPSNSMMSCYDIGGMVPTDLGVCGYNCSLVKADAYDSDILVQCTEGDLNASNCVVNCDTRFL